MLDSVIVEIIAGLIVAGIALTMKDYIVPFLVEIFGEKVKLHPHWVAELNFGTGNIHEVKLLVNKSGHKITGELKFISGRHAAKRYHIYGRFQADILTFYYFPENRSSTSQGACTLKRMKDGELLSGHFAYFSQDKNLIETTKCDFLPSNI